MMSAWQLCVRLKCEISKGRREDRIRAINSLCRKIIMEVQVHVEMLVAGMLSMRILCPLRFSPDPLQPCII